MTETQNYILNEVKVIEEEYLEKGLSPCEWVERYAGKYHKRYWNGSMSEIDMLKNKEGVRL